MLTERTHGADALPPPPTVRTVRAGNVVTEHRNAMQAAELRAIRQRLRISTATLAEFCDVTPKTVRVWLSDRAPVSRTAAVLLRLLAHPAAPVEIIRGQLVWRQAEA